MSVTKKPFNRFDRFHIPGKEAMKKDKGPGTKSHEHQYWHGKGPRDTEAGREMAAVWSYKCIRTGFLALAMMCFVSI